jgi:hypothetical protein
MASLVLSTVGNMILPGLGGVIGGYVGGIIDRKLFGPKAPKTYGPRLGDLTVQTSTEGASLPIVYGTMRIAGNVIWSTGLTEASKKQDAGGGSGGGGGSYTTYSYSTDCAVALCEGTITGVRRIWADTKLIYDVGSNATLETLQASNKNNIRFYTGSETQLCDPLIQAVEGTDLAYRGTAYAVFEDFQLADYGNRLPNFSFEVIKNGNYVSNEYKNSILGTIIPSTYTCGLPIISNNILYLPVYKLNTYPDYFPPATVPYYVTININTPNFFSITNIAPTGSSIIYRSPASSGNACWQVGVLANGKKVFSSESTTAIGTANHKIMIGDIFGYNYLGSIITDIDIIIEQSLRGYSYTGDFANVLLASGEGGRFINVCAIIPGTNTILVTTAAGGIPNNASSTKWFLLDEPSNSVIDSGTISPSISYQYMYRNRNVGALFDTVFEEDYHYGWSRTTETTTLFEIDPITKNMTAKVVVEPYVYLGGTGASYATKSMYIVFAPGRIHVYSRLKNITSSTITLKSVADDITTKSRLPSTSYTYTALNDQTVKGFVVSKVMSAKAALDSLQAGYNFELVEEAGKITAINKANATNKATLTNSTIGAEQI